MNRLILTAFLGILVLVAACNYADLQESMIPKEESEFARDYLEKLKNRELEYIKSYVDPELKEQFTDELLTKMADLFPEGEPISVEIVGSKTHTSNNEWMGNFTFEFQFDGQWIVANTAIKKVGGKTTVIGCNVHQTKASLKDINSLSLANKSIGHYVMLLATVLVPIFMLVSIVFCIRTPMKRRKWLWIIFILFGVGTFRFNWTTGDLSTQLLNFQLFGVGFVSQGTHAPWILTVSFPIGATLFWIRRKKFMSTKKEVQTPVQSEDTKSDNNAL